MLTDTDSHAPHPQRRPVATATSDPPAGPQLAIVLVNYRQWRATAALVGQLRPRRRPPAGLGRNCGRG